MKRWAPSWLTKSRGEKNKGHQAPLRPTFTMVRVVTLGNWMFCAVTNADLALESSEILTGCTWLANTNPLVMVKICSNRLVTTHKKGKGWLFPHVLTVLAWDRFWFLWDDGHRVTLAGVQGQKVSALGTYVIKSSTMPRRMLNLGTL